MLGNCVLFVLCSLEWFYRKQQYLKQLKTKSNIIAKMEASAAKSSQPNSPVANSKPFWKSTIGTSLKDKKRKSFINVEMLQS